jgi:hypothetical protein
LRLGRNAPSTTDFERALTASGAPFAILDVPDPVARELYGHDLLLIRPDLHVAWRGNRPPDDPAAVARVATGQRLATLSSNTANR